MHYTSSWGLTGNINLLYWDQFKNNINPNNKAATILQFSNDKKGWVPLTKKDGNFHVNVTIGYLFYGIKVLNLTLSNLSLTLSRLDLNLSVMK